MRIQWVQRTLVARNSGLVLRHRLFSSTPKVSHLEATIKHYEDALADEKNPLNRLGILKNLIDANRSLGHKNEVVRLLERAVGMIEREFTPESNELVTPLNNLACAYGEVRDITKKQAALERALRIHEIHHGDHHPASFSLWINMVSLYLEDLKEPNKALHYAAKAFSIARTYFGGKGIQTAQALSRLAAVHGALGSRDKQKELLASAYTIAREHDEDHPVAVGIQGEIQKLHMSGNDEKFGGYSSPSRPKQ